VAALAFGQMSSQPLAAQPLRLQWSASQPDQLLASCETPERFLKPAASAAIAAGLPVLETEAGLVEAKPLAEQSPEAFDIGA